MDNAIMRLAEDAVGAGLLPKGITPMQACMAVEVGRGLGLDPLQAMRLIHVIEGRITLKAEAMGGCLQRAGGSIVWHEQTADAAEVECILPSLTPGMPPSRSRVRWTMVDAQRAGLAGRGTWKNYPMAMLSNRALAQGCRSAAPATFMGIYDPDEVDEAMARPTPTLRARVIPGGAPKPEPQTITMDAPETTDPGKRPARPPVSERIPRAQAALLADGLFEAAIAKYGEITGWGHDDLDRVIAWRADELRIRAEAKAAAEAALREPGGDDDGGVA